MHYTKMKEGHGVGSETEPKLGTHIWPGANNVLFVAVRNEEVPVGETVKEGASKGRCEGIHPSHGGKHIKKCEMPRSSSPMRYPEIM